MILLWIVLLELLCLQYISSPITLLKLEMTNREDRSGKHSSNNTYISIVFWWTKTNINPKG